MNSKLIYISTEYVFDGKKGHFRETDPPNPLNYYGKSKLQAEKIVLTGNNDNTVLRTSVIYGSNPKGRFLNFVLETIVLIVCCSLANCICILRTMLVTIAPIIIA